MQIRFQTGVTAQPKFRWLLAVLCLFLICIVSTAQACHSHSDLSPTTKDSRQSVPISDHCQLCVAMHSAMPTAAQTAHGTAEVAEHVTMPPMVERLGTIRVFELQTRPPPAA